MQKAYHNITPRGTLLAECVEYAIPWGPPGDSDRGWAAAG